MMEASTHSCGGSRTRLLLFLMTCLPPLVGAGCQKRPYACEKVSGKVTYEDGGLIPADRIRVVFVSQRPPIDSKTSPRNGSADADIKSGAFDSVTTFAHGDGIISGDHKVVIQCLRGGILAHDLIADEFTDPATTPLTVSSRDTPFDLRVRRPRNVTEQR